MSISDAYRRRYFGPGYVYIAGSLDSRLLKIGTTKQIWLQQRSLQRKRYGSVPDWVLLYHVWADHAGKVEHDARRRLRKFMVLRYYEKDGRVQRAREMVRCDFKVALNAIKNCLSEGQCADAWESPLCDEYDFSRTKPAACVQPKPLEYVPFDAVFLEPVEILDLSFRSLNCLKNNNIHRIGSLVQRSEYELLRTPNFGRKSLNEIKDAVTDLGFRLGMNIIGCDRRDFNALAKFLDTPFLRPVLTVQWSVRTANCLKNAKLFFIGDLVTQTEKELLWTPNFGRKSLNGIKEVLVTMDLLLGMPLPNWPVQLNP